MVTAGTDGFIALWSLPTIFDVPPDDINPARDPTALTMTSRYKVHQSTVKSMAVMSISPDVLLATGGDDNALAFTRIKMSQGDSSQIAFSTLLIPSAHASAINAVQTWSEDGLQDEVEGLPHQRYFSLITTGNDQRIKRWSVTLNLGQPGIKGIHVKRIFNKPSSVADASCLDLVAGPAGKAVAIAGVGIEVWKM